MANLLNTDKPSAPVPLSQALMLIVNAGDTPLVRIEELLNAAGDRGRYLGLILVSLPFVTPLAIPAVSNLIGIIVIFLAFRIGAGGSRPLPRFLGLYEIPRKRLRAIAVAASTALRPIERYLRPRSGEWVNRTPIHRANALLLAWMGLCLAVPLPPVLPFTHMLPCWTIIVLSLAMMERDGRLIFLGYTLAFGTTIYMVVFVGAVIVGSHKLWNWLRLLLAPTAPRFPS